MSKTCFDPCQTTKHSSLHPALHLTSPSVKTVRRQSQLSMRTPILFSHEDEQSPVHHSRRRRHPAQTPKFIVPNACPAAPESNPTTFFAPDESPKSFNRYVRYFATSERFPGMCQHTPRTSESIITVCFRPLTPVKRCHNRRGDHRQRRTPRDD